MHQSKRVLVAPLNWGLGHASRCIPIIHALLERNHKVYLASDGYAALLLKREFPQLRSFSLPSYHIDYPKSPTTWFWIRKLPSLKKAIQTEQAETRVLVNKLDVDTIISDNRYGVYHSKTRNIFITHQLNIPVRPPFHHLVNRLLRSQIEPHFDECWIPDTAGPDNLTGALSAKQLNIPIHFIGPLSRFQKEKRPIMYDLAIVLSGPEPHRTLLQNALISLTPHTSLRIVMILGSPNFELNNRHIQIVPFCNSKELNTILNQSDIILSRSGYSSIMDYYKLHKKAILIPTPGQPEQNYLAKRHGRVDGFETMVKPTNELWEVFRRLQTVKCKVKTTFLPLPEILSRLKI